MLAGMLAGELGILSAVCLGAGTHVSVPHAKRLGRGLDGKASLEHAGGMSGRMTDRLLKLRRLQKEERCASPVCRRAAYVYGLLLEHDQLNRGTHEVLHELLSLTSRRAMEQLRTIARRGHLVDAEGRDAYLPYLDRLAVPVALIQGAESEAFRPEGAEATVAALSAAMRPELVSLQVVPDYGHLDLLIGKAADRDVYPLILEQLERTAAAPVAGELVGA